MKNKMLTIMLIILVSILLVGVIALVVIFKLDDKDAEAKEPSIEEVVEASVDIPEITTNLSSNDYIRIAFKIQTDSKEAKEELAKRDFQVKDVIIEELSEMNSSELEGKKGKQTIENTVKERVNALMQHGKVEKVYITSMMIQ